MRYKSIFVLCAGRCGSVTFIKAASHITNFSSAHESRTAYYGSARFAYPNYHIEADNRLSWLLGRLDQRYGKEAFYIHLQRDLLATASSFFKRHDRGILGAYRRDILMGASKRFPEDEHLLAFCLDYCETVNSNIPAFLKDKPYQMDFHLEAAKSDWTSLWEHIEATGNFDQSLQDRNGT